MNDYESYESMLFWTVPTPVRREDVEEAIRLLSGDAAAAGIVSALQHWLELPSPVYWQMAQKHAFAADLAVKEKAKAALAARIAADEADEAEQLRQRTGWRGLRRRVRCRVRSAWRTLRWRLWAWRNLRHPLTVDEQS